MINGGYANGVSCLCKAERELQRALQDDPQSARAQSALAALYFLESRKELYRWSSTKQSNRIPKLSDALNFLQFPRFR
jgi:Tfp pilus assembly protein PilF